ncbi:NUDIX domain-containing protein [Haloferax namakaokahaiae]|uniref:NUDIX domain-containing protein n=1 Tax=Haloferax namakaokahaiae TaxID=1748331 RepID=A0ABD5ZFN6_9EURY
MVADDSPDIESVAVEPDYCPKCGTAVETNEFEGRETPWCPACDLLFSQNAVAAVQVVVHDGERVLLLDEPIPQSEGILTLPGGYAKYDEGPKEALLRELEEETGLSADPSDLEYLTTYHADLSVVGIYFLTYTLERSATAGELHPQFEEGTVAFRPVEEVLSMTDRRRDSDRERIEMAVERHVE